MIYLQKTSMIESLSPYLRLYQGLYITMAERASLKSYGRFDCHGQQMFYELVLTEKHYLLRYYSETGKLKSIRSLKLPTEHLEIHHAGPYLLCYLHYEAEPSDSEIFVLRLDDCRLNIKKCQHHFQGKKQDQKAIKLIYFNQTQQLFVFVDQERNIYIVTLEEEAIKCQKIHKSDRDIKRIQLNRDNQIVLTTYDRKLKVLVMDQKFKKIVQTLSPADDADYYFQNGFQVLFYDSNPGLHTNDKLLTLQIRQAGTYKYLLDRGANLIFYSNKQDVMIVFDPKNHQFIHLIQGIFKIYGNETQDKSLPLNMTDDNFLVTYKKDSQRNMMIELRVYNDTTQEFKLYQYFVSETDKKLNYLVILRKNIDKIFNINGLINPLHEGIVSKALKELEYNNSDFQKSRYMNQEDNEDNFIDLACKLVRYGLQFFPRELTAIVHKIKGHIMNIKDTYCILQTKRIFEYCETIQDEITSDLKNIYENMDRAHRLGELMSSVESQQEKRLIGHSQLLQNMINFIFQLINELEIELQIFQKEQNSQRQDSKEIKNLQEHLDYYKEIKNLQEHLDYYKEIRQSAKSLFVITRMLEDKQIPQKIQLRLQKLRSKRETNVKLWEDEYSSLVRMQYFPSFLHQYFKDLSALAQTEGKSPTFVQFFYYLLQSKKNFLEIAYFYQYITKSTSVPFLSTDVNDLLQSILSHCPLMPEPVSIDAMILKETQENKSQFQENEQTIRIPNLLHRMTGTTLNIKEYSFIKYLIQLTIFHKQYPLTVMLVHSNAYSLDKEDPLSDKEHVFMIKSLLLSGNFNLAYLYVLKNYKKSLFAEFVHWAKINGNLLQLLSCKLQKKLIQQDDQSLLQWLELTPDMQLSVATVLSEIK